MFVLHLCLLTAWCLDSSHLFHYHLVRLAYFQEIMEVMPYLGHHMWYPCRTVAVSCTPIYPETWTLITRILFCLGPICKNTHTIKPLRSGQLSNKNSIVGSQNSIVRASSYILYS